MRKYLDPLLWFGVLICFCLIIAIGVYNEHWGESQEKFSIEKTCEIYIQNSEDYHQGWKQCRQDLKEYQQNIGECEKDRDECQSLVQPLKDMAVECVTEKIRVKRN